MIGPCRRPDATNAPVVRLHGFLLSAWVECQKHCRPEDSTTTLICSFLCSPRLLARSGAAPDSEPCPPAHDSSLDPSPKGAPAAHVCLGWRRPNRQPIAGGRAPRSKPALLRADGVGEAPTWWERAGTPLDLASPMGGAILRTLLQHSAANRAVSGSAAWPVPPECVGYAASNAPLPRDSPATPN